MPRPSKPWYWEARQEWYVKINKVRHRLGPDKAEAERRFHELMAKPEPKVQSDSVAYMIDLFLEWTQKRKAPLTYVWYQKHLQSFLDSLKPKMLCVAQLKPHHVHAWADSHEWGDTYRRGAMVAVSRVFNWAEKMGHIDRTPLRKLEKPTAATRTETISQSEYESILALASNWFHDLLVTAWETGCRPQEITRVEARHVDLENCRWVFPANEAKGKKRPRHVYLPSASLKITKRLMKKYPSGPLFRNRYGARWTAYAIACCFKRIQKKLGKQFCLYSFRHTWCTNALKNEMSPVTVAELMGHEDLTMIKKIYSHIAQDPKFMRDAARQAVQ